MRWRHKNSRQDRSRREGTETGWNQDIKAYKSLYFNVQKILMYQVLKYDTSLAMTTLLRSCLLRKKGWIWSVALSQPYAWDIFSSTPISSKCYYKPHAHKTTKKIEVGIISDNENRASFACRWPPLKSGLLSTRQHGYLSFWVTVTRAENGWLDGWMAVLVQFLIAIFRD